MCEFLIELVKGIKVKCENSPEQGAMIDENLAREHDKLLTEIIDMIYEADDRCNI